MKIPTNIQINDSTWTIQLDAEIEKTHGAVGLCIYDLQKILISPNQDRNEIEETFIHELLHACFPDNVCSPKLEEKIVKQLSITLTKTLRDNKIRLGGTGKKKST